MTQAYNLSQLANNLNSSGQLDATDGLVNSVPVANGGTGASTAVAARTNLNVPTRTGEDASGTWNISILGNAATATSATSATNATNATNATYATTAGNGGVTSVNGQTGAVTVNVNTSTVLAAIAGASAGSVGSYAFLKWRGNNTAYAADTLLAGSSFNYASVSPQYQNSDNSPVPASVITSGTPSGTWRVMGYISNSTNVQYSGSAGGSTLCLRIS